MGNVKSVLFGESLSAVASESLSAVASVSDSGVVPLTNEVDGAVPLTEAEEQEYQLPQDADVVDITDPFLTAITAGDHDSVKRMLQEGQDMYVKLEQATDFSWKRRKLNAMLLAIDHDHLNIVELLLEEGYDIETQNDDKEYTTPLMYATIKGNYEIVKYLLSRGAHVNAIDYLSLTPLAMACRLKYLSIADLLLENGADPNNFSVITMEEDRRVKMKFKDVDDEKSAVRNRTSYFNTATYEAAANGLTELVARLVANGADVNTKSSTGRTPLSGAAHYGYLDTVQLLLQHGSDVNNNLTVKPCKRDDEGGNIFPKYRPGCRCCNKARSFVNCSPLHLAVNNGHIPVINCLLQYGADPNIASDNNTTPLMTAAGMKSIEIVRILLHHGADVLMSDDFDSTAISHACERFAEGDLDLVKLLLSKCPPAYMFPRSTILQGPCRCISQPAIKERKELIQLLLDRVRTIQDGSFCPIAAACKTIDRDAQEEPVNSPSVGNDAEANSIISANLDIVKLLLQRGANPNYLSGFQSSSCLHYCYYHTDLSIIHALIEAGADPTIKDRNGETVFDLIEQDSEAGYMDTRAEILRLHSNKVNFDRRKAFLTVLVENGYIPSSAHLPLNGPQDLVLQNIDIVKLIFAYL